jgi:magnesium transporter
VAKILNDMPPDERTELLEEVPGELVQRLLSTLRGDESEIARSLLNYPEDSIGRLMTPEYVAVRPEWTMDEVFEHIREVGEEMETFNVVYVVDEHWELLDELRLERLVLAGREDTVQDLMDRQVGALQVYDDQEEAIELFRKYEALAMPVVNTQGVLLGIVTVDDVMDVEKEEATEDIQMMAAVRTLKHPYLATPYIHMMIKRLPWLVLLFLAEILTVAALDVFRANLDQAVLAIMVGFVPLINSCAGNTGSQMSALVLRSLAVAELGPADWHRVLGRELLRGLSLGVVIGGMGLATALVFQKPLGLGIGVMVALISVMLLANVVGAMLPLLLKWIRVDPAVTSGPFIASMMDVSAIVIYFSVASSILRATG